MINKAKEIVKFFNRIYERRLTTASGGNISLKSKNKILVSPTGIDKANLKPEEIAVYDLKKNIFLNENKPTCEFNMHTKIYENREDVNAIIHAHPTYSTIFSLIKTPLDLSLLSETYIFVRKISYVDYGMPSSIELAEDVAENSKESDVLILRNHGVVILGKNLMECFHKLETLENLAKIQYKILGRKDIIKISEKEIEKIDQNF